MAPDSTPLHDANRSPRESRIVPANTYYVMPYFGHFVCVFSLAGSFSCAQISDYVSTATSAILWTIFGISILVMMLLGHPIFRLERKKMDEEGKEVTLRCPIIGFKACEVDLDLEGINKGLYDPEDGSVDPRLHDGCRYGPALLRI